MKIEQRFKRIFISLAFFLCIFILNSPSFVSGAPNKSPLHAQNIVTSGVVIDLSILGMPLASKEQCLKYLLKQNPLPLLSVSPQQLIDYYYIEGMREGVRPDIAFAQALHETGNFRYGGDVIPIQNNYCGLGTVGGGVKGAFFPTAEIGVRAQIQHLLVYASKRPPSLPIVDPRYNLVKYGENFGKLHTWTSLNGKWAVPGKTYGQKILAIHRKILAEKPD